MADIELKITIARPIGDVFKAATDYENTEAIKTWQRAVVSLGITEGKPLRTGSMIAMTRQFMMSKIFVNWDVLDFQRNKRLELSGIHGRFRYRRDIEFVPNGRETSITDRVTVNTGFIYFWYRPFLLNAIRSQIKQEWDTLKKQLET